MANQTSQDDDPVGSPLQKVPVASIVIVTVQITTPDALDSTTVRVLMPGGLEPVDPNIQGDDGSSFCPLPFFDFFRASFYFNCPVQETLPSVVTFRHSHLSPGTHTMRFRAIAATPGTFSLPPTLASVNKEPELMGLSAAGTFEVCSGKECEPATSEASALPKACPQDCNGNGMCNVGEGKCLCFEGFEGKECEKFSEVA